MTDQYPTWIQVLLHHVIDRDKSACINCRKPAADIHHIIPRSRGKKHSRKLWREENMCCVCRECHTDGQTRWMRERLVGRMWALYAYDMSWTREYGVVMEEVA